MASEDPKNDPRVETAEDDELAVETETAPKSYDADSMSSMDKMADHADERETSKSTTVALKEVSWLAR
jgi:hypothetical protein